MENAEGNPDHWGAKHKEHQSRQPLGWLDNGYVVRHRVFPMLFPGQQVDGWWEATLPMLGVPRGGTWLDLGCGAGSMEIGLAKAGMFDTMLALDASPGSIEVAREGAAREGLTNLTFDVADANTVELEPESYDVVHITMALHHVREIEHVINQINRALKPGGVFVANDYVGPSQFQFSDERMGLVNQLLASLPERLRWDPVVQAVKESHPRFSRAYWNEYDPTEAVRSEEIPQVLAWNFPRMRRHDYGGNLLNLVLENIVQNFDTESQDDLAHLDRLFAAEDEVLAREPSDFAMFVCPRGSLPARLRGQWAAGWARRRVVPAVARYEPDELGLSELRGNADPQPGAPVPATRPVVGATVRVANGLARRGVGWFIGPVLESQRRMNHGMIDAVGRLREHSTTRLDHVRADTDRLSTEVAVLRRELDQLRTGTEQPSRSVPALASLLQPFLRPVVIGPDADDVAAAVDRQGQAPVTAVAAPSEAAGLPPGPDGVLLTAPALPGDGGGLVKLLEEVRGLVDGGGQLLIEVPTAPEGWVFPDPAQLVVALSGTGFEHARIEVVPPPGGTDLVGRIEGARAGAGGGLVARAFVPLAGR